MDRRDVLLRLLGCLLVVRAALPAADAQSPQEFFELKVRPVLATRCGACHQATKMGGLQLDSRAHALAGGKSGPAILPGHAADSLLIQAVNQTHARLKMPPTGKLTDDEIAALTRWVDAGAVWPDAAPSASAKAARSSHWAFQPVKEPTPPKVNAPTAIDKFILAALEAKGLKPVRPADRRALIRRATFDLTGLPPTPAEVDAFLADRTPGAFAKVVDRLLASPRYGERWGRYWLDIARYSDDKLNSTQDEPYPNAFRYRDWVIDAFNRDLPYDTFVKAQIAGDLLPEKQPAALGFYALSPEFQDDRVDATTRGFLALTVACAQCHDHKFDPIPQQDYYSLLSVFNNSTPHEYPLAPEPEVKAWRDQKAKVDKVEKEIKDFVDRQGKDLAEILAAQASRYLLAHAKLAPPGGQEAGLDAETAKKWAKYLERTSREHPFLKDWDAKPTPEAARAFEQLLLDVNAEQKLVEDKNHIKLGLDPSRNDLSQANLESMPRDRYVLWHEVFETVLKYGEKDLPRYLSGPWKQHLESLQAQLKKEKDALPKQYPFLHGIEDAKTLKKQRVYLRGARENPGEEVPARFLATLSHGDRQPFTHGSGRLDLAEAIADPKNPLTARVMVNRIWMGHMGAGLVRTPGNFGNLGERPSHPELLDYLAARFVSGAWSMKKLHREIMLTSTYQLSSAHSARNFTADPDNRLLWRATRRRLDAESLRDAMLFVSGDLELKDGGPPIPIADEKNHRRTVYGFVSRRKLDPMLALFDFPNPIATSEQRIPTNVPLQRLYFMNSPAVAREAKALAANLPGADDRAKIQTAYLRLYGRAATAEEIKLGLDFLRDAPWPQYAQVLLSSNEFNFVE
jgi:cytochrome c553